MICHGIKGVTEVGKSILPIFLQCNSRWWRISTSYFAMKSSPAIIYVNMCFVFKVSEVVFASIIRWWCDEWRIASLDMNTLFGCHSWHQSLCRSRRQSLKRRIQTQSSYIWTTDKTSWYTVAEKASNHVNK